VNIKRRLEEVKMVSYLVMKQISFLKRKKNYLFKKKSPIVDVVACR
jgi:hypothetical protein